MLNYHKDKLTTNMMPEIRPIVTILMASYGRLSLLKKSVESALAQEFTNFEVLIVDDGSDEETKNWLRMAQMQHDRLRVVFQDHQGVAAARARGVIEARGDQICILDSDDMLNLRALQRLTKELAQYPGSAMVYTGIRELLPNGTARIQEYPAFRTPHHMLWAILLKPRVPFKHSGTMFHRDMAIKLGAYDKNLPCKVDIDLFLKFLRAGYQPRLVPEPLVDFRMHKDSISRNRMLGLRVWFLLIDRYGPPNPFIRLGIKIVRTFSELSKQLYLEIIG